VKSTFQPLALIVGLALLVGLRLVANYDPIAEFIQSRLPTHQSAPSTPSDPRLEQLNKQINSLKSALDFKSNHTGRLIGLNILNKTTASFRLSLKIDGGKEVGIKPDQAVIHNGLMIGVIGFVEANSATVLLVGDPEVKIAVNVNGADGLVEAKAGGKVVTNLNQVEFSPGQTVITSGLGGLYPPGLVIGQLGANLPTEFFSEYVLEQDFSVGEISFVQVLVL